MSEALPRDGELLELAKRFPTNQAMADHLGVPRETLRDHIYRENMQTAVHAARAVATADPVLPLNQPESGMRILLLDIETSPALAYIWSLYDQYTPIDRLVEPVEVLCWAAKWLDDPAVEFRSVHHDGREEMVRRMWTLLDEADAVVHYNGKKFDIPHLNREFLNCNLHPPAPYQQIDLLMTARRKFKWPSNKLAYVTQALGLDEKVKHEGFSLWIKCMAGDDDAWARMRHYNVTDMTILENLYKRLLPWIDHHPSHGAMMEDDVCPKCGGRDLQSRGSAYTKTGRYARYQCKGCGSWSRDTRRSGGTGRTEAAA